MKDFVPHPILEKCDYLSPDTPVFAVSGREVLISERNGKSELPLLHEIPEGMLDKSSGIVLGRLDGRICAGFVCCGQGSYQCSSVEMRTAFTLLSSDACNALCRAKILLDWKRRRTFCGACGTPLVPSVSDISMKCPACKEAFYPQLAPAVIVAVTKGDKILLAHNYRFKERVHSLIAGFVEAGESLVQLFYCHSHCG